MIPIRAHIPFSNPPFSTCPLIQPQRRPWVVKFDASPVVANELQASLRLNTDVLRATFCKQPSVASNPNPRFHKCKNLGRPNDKDDVETTFTSTSGLGGR